MASTYKTHTPQTDNTSFILKTMTMICLARGDGCGSLKYHSLEGAVKVDSKGNLFSQVKCLFFYFDSVTCLNFFFISILKILLIRTLTFLSYVLNLQEDTDRVRRTGFNLKV